MVPRKQSHEATAGNPRFDDSYARVFGHEVAADKGADAFFAAFYHRFLDHQDIRRLFRGTDMGRQTAMLRKSFFHLAAFSVTGEPSGELERMAALHARLGIDSDHYDRWLDCLVATVAEYDPQCNAETVLAWRCALIPGITYMKLYEHFRERFAT